MDFARLDDDETEEHELCFDGPEPEAPPPASARAGRKRPARGKVAAAEVAPPPPEPAEPPPPANDPEPACAPISPPVVERASRLPTLTMVLAAVAALFSAIGLLATARNLAALEVSREEVAAREKSLARVPHLIEQAEALLGRHRIELDRLAAKRQTEPLTRAELAAQLDGLRYALSRMQAPGTTALAGMMRAGQAELADSIEELNDRVEQAEKGARRPSAH